MSRTIKEAFSSIKADEEMKAATKKVLLEELDASSSKGGKFQTFLHGKPAFYRAIAGTLILVLIAAGSMHMYERRAEAAYLTMEGPVQIGLSVNGKNSVISAEGLNDEGDHVISQVEVTGMDYEEALKTIMSSSAYEQCQGGKAKVSVSCHDEEQSAAMQESADETCHAYGKHYKTHHQEDREDVSREYDESSDSQEESTDQPSGSDSSSSEEHHHKNRERHHKNES